jgi:hypothetical protein
MSRPAGFLPLLRRWFWWLVLGVIGIIVVSVVIDWFRHGIILIRIFW